MDIYKLYGYSGKLYNGIPIEVIQKHHQKNIKRSLDKNADLTQIYKDQKEYIQEIEFWKKLSQESDRIEKENLKNLDLTVSKALDEILKPLLQK